MDPNNLSRPLPKPGEDAAVLSNKLAGVLARRIDAYGNALPFDEFMQTALYESGLGYYANGLQKFGAQGDFITAPGSGDLFGCCIARQCEQVLSGVGGDIIEFGAGDGALAAQILKSINQAFAGRYFILELSPALAARQREHVALECPEKLGRVVWLDALPETFIGVVLVNEVLDAMPVKRIEYTDSGWRELAVQNQNKEFGWIHKPVTNAAQTYIENNVIDHEFPIGYQTELHTHAAAWMRSLGDWLDRGIALLIDYGYSAAEYYRPDRVSGSLRCHYRQLAHDDPFALPGLQDITAHVNFTAMAQATFDAGLDVLGYTQQAPFLMSLGIMDDHTNNNNAENLSAIKMTKRAQEIKRLTMPDQMGELFKVLAVGRGFECELAGMRLQNHLDRL